jgi:hypothetical protein
MSAEFIASMFEAQAKLLLQQAEQLRGGEHSETVETDGKKKKLKVKKEKDPNAVKRPLSAYQIFIGEEYKNLKARNPEIPSKELFGVLSQQWKSISDEKKAMYNKKSQDLKDHAAEDHSVAASPAPVAAPAEKKAESNKNKPPVVKVKETAPAPAPVPAPKTEEKKERDHSTEESAKKHKHKKDKENKKKRHSEGGDDHGKKKVRLLQL